MPPEHAVVERKEESGSDETSPSRKHSPNASLHG